MDAVAGLDIPQSHIFVEKLSGKDFNRPAYRELVERLEEGDLLYIQSIDRLGRNYSEILEEWRVLTKEIGVDIAVLDMPLLSTVSHKDLLGTLIADLTLQLLSFVAHNERDIIRKRQAEGIASAKARGVRFGRPVKKPPKNFERIIKKWERGQIDLSQVLEQTGFSESTFFRRLRDFRGF